MPETAPAPPAAQPSPVDLCMLMNCCAWRGTPCDPHSLTAGGKFVGARRWAAPCWRGQRFQRDVAEAALAQQVVFANRNRARRPDGCVYLNGQRPFIPGTGKWKQMDPSQVLRSAFSCSAATMKSIAEAAGCPNRHMTDLL